MMLKMRLLHFARVRSAADQHGAPGEVQQDEDFGVHAVAFGIGLELRCGDDGELRTMMPLSSSAVGRINNCRTKRLCQAYSFTMRTGRR